MESERTTFCRSMGALYALFLVCGSAQATSLSYTLDRSNILANGVSYMQVTVADGANGAIDFTVTPLQPLLDLAGDRFEIRGFGFNALGGIDLSDDNIAGLPDHWQLHGTRKMDGFGWFDFSVSGGSASNTTSLVFSIIGIDGDTPESYVDFSRGPANEGTALFAARLFGLVEGGACDSKDEKCVRGRPLNNVYVAGSNQLVPLPATAWMFLTGMAGVLFRARRRRSHAA